MNLLGKNRRAPCSSRRQSAKESTETVDCIILKAHFVVDSIYFSFSGNICNYIGWEVGVFVRLLLRGVGYANTVQALSICHRANTQSQGCAAKRPFSLFCVVLSKEAEWGLLLSNADIQGHLVDERQGKNTLLSCLLLLFCPASQAA